MMARKTQLPFLDASSDRPDITSTITRKLHSGLLFQILKKYGLRNVLENLWGQFHYFSAREKQVPSHPTLELQVFLVMF